MRSVTIGLSVHTTEMIAVISKEMRRQEAIFLEEPPVPEFSDMLHGNLSIDKYLLRLDLEYPEFSRGMYRLLRQFHKQGRKIFQVEPYLEVLLQIHDFFAAGHAPDEIKRDTLQYPVYLAERNATGALLSYYQAVSSGTFEEAISAILRFARLDAIRFRLRDSLRAQALAPLVERYASSYVEAGVIHYPLWRLLRQQVSPQVRVKPLFLSEQVLKKTGEKGHLYGPGDRLTLLYIFHPGISNTAGERLLAARSMIYSKIIEKEEQIKDQAAYPHLRNELACIRMTNRLSLDDCERLFLWVRRAKSSDARQIVAEYVSEWIPVSAGTEISVIEDILKYCHRSDEQAEENDYAR